MPRENFEVLTIYLAIPSPLRREQRANHHRSRKGGLRRRSPGSRRDGAWDWRRRAGSRPPAAGGDYWAAAGAATVVAGPLRRVSPGRQQCRWCSRRRRHPKARHFWWPPRSPGCCAGDDCVDGDRIHRSGHHGCSCVRRSFPRRPWRWQRCPKGAAGLKKIIVFSLSWTCRESWISQGLGVVW